MTASFPKSKFDDGKGAFLFLDGFGLHSPRSGIAHHITEIYKSFKEMRLDPILLIHSSWKRGLLELGFEENHLYVVSKSPLFKSNRLLWWLRISKFLQNLRLDGQKIFHGFSNYNVPFGLDRTWHCFLTIHDLIPLQYPDSVSTAYRIQFSYLFNSAIKSNPHMIVVSEATMDEVKKRGDIEEENLHLVENGCEIGSEELWQGEITEKVCLLYVARNESYKRIPFCIEVLKFLPDHFKLTLVTDHGALDSLRAANKELLSSDRLTILSDLGREQIKRVYIQSDLYLNTSLCEGFGLPLVEAAASGSVVVTHKKVGISYRFDEKVAVFPSQLESPSHWAECVKQAIELRNQPQFQNDLRSFLNSLPTWGDSAKKISALYQLSLS